MDDEESFEDLFNFLDKLKTANSFIGAFTKEEAVVDPFIKDVFARINKTLEIGDIQEYNFDHAQPV